MTEKQTGGPAFPINANESADRCIYTGMTLRDYFAAKALTLVWPDGDDDEHVAQRAYEVADEMLKARKT